VVETVRLNSSCAYRGARACARIRQLTGLVLFLLCWPLPGNTAGATPGAAAVATAHPLATAAARATLRAGGNAFDAAVSIAAALAVVEPASSGLGGGGFWLLHRARDGFEVMIDARERAPLAARADMYLDKDGNPVPRLSLDGPLAAAIPGTPAALAHMARRYGRLPLSQTLAPAIRLARDGFPVTPRYRRLARLRLKALRASPAAAEVFLRDGAVPHEGFVVRQSDLAVVFERIVRQGRAGFYAGETAKELVAGVRAADGIWRLEDLAAYHVVERAPVTGRYGWLRITSATLPSSGGIVLLQMLNILAGYDLASQPRTSRDHLLIESMRRAYRDRARYLGDSDFVSVDVRGLLSQAHAAKLRASISPRAASASDTLPDAAPSSRGANTTHFSVIDRQGNRVAATLTVNYAFGSGFVAPGTGVLLNNEMDDFVLKPGVPNLYGLVGNKANAIAPGKRPLSSMTPTFLESPDAVVILGTPGGSRIITMVLLATLEVARGRGGARDWVALPRFHHQYLPDVVQFEPRAFQQAEIEALRRLGHRLKRRKRPYGNMQIVAWDKETNRLDAASDPRGEGAVWIERRREAP
jgi:gamma-glutamyltranspeptidase/glutathione hydrolase